MIGPQELHLELTFKCNSRCIMCDLWGKTDNRAELGFKEITSFVKKSKLLKDIKKVVLSGGEPWLREDFSEICNFFLKLYPESSIGILTNLLEKALSFNPMVLVLISKMFDFVTLLINSGQSLNSNFKM